jgi:putative hemolysin
MLAMGTKVRARMYQEFLQRVGKGEKLTLAEKRMMEKIGAELAAEVNGEKAPAAVDGKIETPLEFMLRIMNDPNEPEEFRARMATSAAPFCHVRKGEGAGKKEEKNERAKTAGAGRFASMAGRLQVVK